MSDKVLNRELTIWAEAGTRDTAFELPLKNTPGRPRVTVVGRGKRNRVTLINKSEQLSLFI